MIRIEDLEGNAQAFAVAGYDCNTILELETALETGPDKTDMKEWELTSEEWFEAIQAALNEKKAAEAEE